MDMRPSAFLLVIIDGYQPLVSSAKLFVDKSECMNVLACVIYRPIYLS